MNAVSSKRMCVSYSAIAFALAFAFDGVEAHAQQTGKVFRIGFLDPSTASGMAVLVDAFRDELNKLGWIEGKNIKIEYRFAEQSLSRHEEIVSGEAAAPYRYRVLIPCLAEPAMRLLEHWTTRLKAYLAIYLAYDFLALGITLLATSAGSSRAVAPVAAVAGAGAITFSSRASTL